MDLGDAWEHSDDPGYPADMAMTGHRILVNYATYKPDPLMRCPGRCADF
jgi:hypothetical protein